MRTFTILLLLLCSVSVSAAQRGVQGSGEIAATAMVQRPTVMFASGSEPVATPAAGARQQSTLGGLKLSFNAGASYEVTVEAASRPGGQATAAGPTTEQSPVRWCAGSCRSVSQFRSLEAARPVVIASSRSASPSVVDLRFDLPATVRDTMEAASGAVILTVVID